MNDLDPAPIKSAASVIRTSKRYRERGGPVDAIFTPTPTTAHSLEILTSRSILTHSYTRPDRVFGGFFEELWLIRGQKSKWRHQRGRRRKRECDLKHV